MAPAPPVLPSALPRHLPAQAPTRPPARPVASHPSPPATASPPPPATVAEPVAPPPPPSPPRSSPAWLAGVSQWLAAHRTYPEMARRFGQQGTVTVQFTVDRDGHVLEVTLVRGSGTEALDQAAQALLRNARLPPFPPDMPLAQQSLTVPVRYLLE